MTMIDHAEYELDLLDFSPADKVVMLDILVAFFRQWDSGGAVWAMAPVLQKLIAGKPLSPLTGEDDEWVEVDERVWQNRRCGTVFKQERLDFGEGLFCYDIGNIDVIITFPYDPENIEVASPVIEVTT